MRQAITPIHGHTQPLTYTRKGIYQSQQSWESCFTPLFIITDSTRTQLQNASQSATQCKLPRFNYCGEIKKEACVCEKKGAKEMRLRPFSLSKH